MSKRDTIEQLFETMGRLKKLLESRSPETHEEKAASLMQYAALTYLQAQTERTVSDIAEHLHLSKSSATQLIERLVRAGFVERVDDPHDRRLVRLLLTPLGQAHLGLLKKHFTERLAAVFERIPEGDLKELVRIQSELVDTLEKEGQG